MDGLPITSSTGVLAALSGICAFFFWIEKRTQWRFFQFAPPLVFIYLVPMLLSTGGVLPHKSPVYDAMKTFLLPMLLVLLLTKMNMRGAVRVLGRGLGVMLFGSLGVMIGAPIGLLVVKHWLHPDAWKAFGALAASWVGGTANLAAVAEMLHTNGVESLSMLADSTITYLVWLPILLASKRYANRFARFTGVDSGEAERMEEAASVHQETPTAPTTNDYLFLLSVALIATWVADAGGNWIEQQATSWFPPTVIVKPEANPQQSSPAAGLQQSPTAVSEKSPFADATTWRILIATTIGIGLSFTPLSRISGSQELAMALLYLFVTRMGATADLGQERVGDQIVPFLIAALIWIFIHGAFCLLGAKIFRTDIHTAAIASAANIGGVATASIVASYHQRSLLPAAILMAIIGYAIGTYCGFITAYICKMLM
jgi:uncharacterized membrane protein